MQKLLIENENYNCEIKHKEEHAKREEDCDNEHRRTHRHTDKPRDLRLVALSHPTK